MQQIQEESAKLQASYAGDRAKEITNREQEVVAAWAALQASCDQRKGKLADTGMHCKIFNYIYMRLLFSNFCILSISSIS